MAGPLSGYKIIEILGVGAGPYCGTMLADMGAEVVRIDRPRDPAPRVGDDPLARGRQTLCLDLKSAEGRDVLLRMVEGADCLFEGYRPGVMERLGIGPDECMQRNPRLIFGRITGWGQEGPYAQLAGHDINYIALAGVLAHIGTEEQAVPPLNLIGDFAGGGFLLAYGIVCALLEREKSGKGQVIDAAMVDGAALLMTMFFGPGFTGLTKLSGRPRASTLLDGGAFYYNAYRCADGKLVAIGPAEPQFYQLLLELLGLQDDEDFAAQRDMSRWPRLKERMAELFATKTSAEWCEILEHTDACFAPVLSFEEAPDHPHNRHRKTFVDVGGRIQPAPAPRFSRTPADAPTPPGEWGVATEAVLAGWGFTGDEISSLVGDGVVG
jgi:alpha-methylacyl-CoA racemase